MARWFGRVLRGIRGFCARIGLFRGGGLGFLVVIRSHLRRENRAWRQSGEAEFP
jgi:hypothetical protein